jgi:pimeloyl-ACP methyl ester carboxylesterase
VLVALAFLRGSAARVTGGSTTPILVSAPPSIRVTIDDAEGQAMGDRGVLRDDTVVLVPGFLGFSTLGRFPYFADRVPASLTAALLERWNRPVSVVPASTVPTGTLQARIAELAQLLGRLLAKGARRLYLVGHSTGGVDAQLLMCRAPFWGGEWSANDQAARAQVAAVVTISAPHHGTSLLDSPAAKFIDHPSLGGALPFLQATTPLAALAVRDLSQVDTLLDLNTKQLPNAWRFVFSVLRHHELLDELRQPFMASVRQRVVAEPRVPVTCFVTGADVIAEGPHKSDPFYAELNSFGSSGASAATAAVDDNVRRIASADAGAWIRGPESVPYRIQPATNDGIVNTACQLIEGADLGGVVVADHADVIGDYDRWDIATELPMDTGIFHSGAGFGDDQFFELYSRVASALGEPPKR